MYYLDKLFKNNPAAKLQFETDQAKLEKKYKERITTAESNNNINRVQAITTIPVVVHIILPNANDVTDAAVLDQINILNANFSGLNIDSANATGFFPVRGHSEIRFCLAQRTPGDLPSTGIERRNSNTLSGGSGNSDPIKFTAQGGLDSWDPTKYLNIWVCDFTSPGAGLILLGYATFPGLAVPLIEHGLAINYRSFSSINPTSTTLFTFSNQGKTTVHELGHFFNLRHIWGDASGCSTDDLISDTPLQDVATNSCPLGNVFDACTTAGTGINFQNYMDYSDDPCLTMFTKLQGVRMQTALSDPTRIGLTTSNGCTPPVITANDASLSALIAPATSFITCDPTTPLTITVRNAGLNNLTSVIITVKNNGVTVQTFIPAGLNLATGATQNFTLNPIALSIGLNIIDVCTSLPNGVADTGPGNDCKSTIAQRVTSSALPLVEGFEDAAFPPAGWLRNNLDGGLTWERNTTGQMHGGIAGAFVNHFSYATDVAVDDLITPPFTIGTADSLWVSFWGSYKGYPNVSSDEFQLAVSTNCGNSFTTVFNVTDISEFAVPPVTTTVSYTPSSINQWVKKSFDLTSLIPTGNVQVRFRAVNRFANNFYLDDINIDKKIFQNNDAGVLSIDNPGSRTCVNAGAPVAVIKNFGKTNLTSVKINYQIDGAGAISTITWTGNLPRNQTATVTLPATSFGSLGNHSIRIYTTEPNNITDQDATNDSQTKPFQILQIFSLPTNVTEEFTSNTFPPTNWNVYNPDADMTWARNSSIGKKAIGSAWFNDFNNNSFDRMDDLALPNYSYSGIDSIFLTFNLAAISKSLPGTGSRLDTLSVLLSKDCGNTFTTIYKKYGEELKTIPDPNIQNSLVEFFPASTQWRLDSLNLGEWLGGTEPLFQVVFRFHGNFENNLFLDDINLKTKNLPARLKSDGYLVLPNPFHNKFNVWHYQPPTTLRYINVYNAIGQLVWSKKYNENEADKLIEIDLGGRAAGVYSVTLGYADKSQNVNVQVVKY